MIMKLEQAFKNVAAYAAGMETWVKHSYSGELEYSFTSDFAVADWISGVKGVVETYQRVKDEWLDNYKAFTEVVISLNMLCWAHNRLKKQNIDDRDTFIELYSNMYHQAVIDFYDHYDDNEEARSYFYHMTD